MSDTEVEKKQPQVMMNAQYVKDLSFESPKAPASLTGFKSAPAIELGIDVNVQKMSDTEFEVTLNIKAKAKHEENDIFVAELQYSGLFTIENISNETEKEHILLIYCPSLIFPFARRVIADITRDGGFQPLMIAPIDFANLYMQHKNSAN